MAIRVVRLGSPRAPDEQRALLTELLQMVASLRRRRH